MEIRWQSAAFVASMKKAQTHFHSLVLEAVRHAARLAAQFAKTSGLYKQRSGRLAESIKPHDVGEFHSQTVAGAPHAAWVEYGNTFRSGQQYIYPKNGKFLKFEVDGQIVFARRVKASKPRPFMDEAEQKTIPLFDRLCQDAVRKMF